MRLMHEFDSLWFQVIRSKYDIPQAGVVVNSSGRISCRWKDIMRLAIWNMVHADLIQILAEN